MTLKELLIQEIENLHVIHALAERARRTVPIGRNGYVTARQALAGCAGNLSDDISRGRDDRA